MRIIACGDIHMDTANIRNIPAVSEADLILINGDLTNFGGEAEAKTVLDQISAINNRIYAQFGNLDKADVGAVLDELGINMHGRAIVVQEKLCIIGVGGSNPTPFGTPTEFSEEELYETAAAGFEQAKKSAGIGTTLPTILISHPPPLDTKLDDIGKGTHVGSSAIAKIIKKYRPNACICGHIHEAFGQDMIGNTPIFNPGMLSKGGFIEIRLTDNRKLDVSLQKITL